MVRAAALFSTPESARKGPQKQDPFEQLSVPGPADDDNLRIDAPQSSVRDSHPSPRPPHPALPLPRCPEQQRRHDARDEAHLLQHVHQPILTASTALAIFARPQEDEVEEDDEIYSQKCEDKRVLPPTRAEGEILGAQGGFEDEQVEVYLRRRAWQQRCRVCYRGRTGVLERGYAVVGIVRRVYERRRVWWGVRVCGCCDGID
jgi:hypothetical protein